MDDVPDDIACQINEAFELADVEESQIQVLRILAYTVEMYHAAQCTNKDCEHGGKKWWHIADEKFFGNMVQGI